MAAANLTIAKLNTDVPIQTIGSMGMTAIRIALGASATYDTGGIALSRDKVAGVLGWRTIHFLIPYRVFSDSDGDGTNIQAYWDAAAHKIKLDQTGTTPAEIANSTALSAAFAIDCLAFGL